MELVCNSFPSVVQGRFSGVRVQKLIKQFFPWSSQLEKLTLNPIAEGFNPSSILSFAKLKQLIMCITVDYDDSLLAWMYLIDACSLLRKFKFVVMWYDISREFIKEPVKVSNKVHLYLEHFHFVEFFQF